MTLNRICNVFWWVFERFNNHCRVCTLQTAYTPPDFLPKPHIHPTAYTPKILPNAYRDRMEGEKNFGPFLVPDIELSVRSLWRPQKHPATIGRAQERFCDEKLLRLQSSDLLIPRIRCFFAGFGLRSSVNVRILEIPLTSRRKIGRIPSDSRLVALRIV